MTKEQIINGLTCHSKLNLETDERYDSCNNCPYKDFENCSVALTIDALCVLCEQHITPNFINVGDYIININDIDIVEVNYSHSEINIYYQSGSPRLRIDMKSHENCFMAYNYIVKQLVKREATRNEKQNN